jgi:hypothetical protein
MEALEWHCHLLPDGRSVEFSFAEKTHVYSVKTDGQLIEVPSCTQILEESGLCEDYSEVPANVLERKRVIGSYVHKAAHYHHLGDLEVESIDSQIAPYFQGYLKFLKDSGFQVQDAERRVVGCWQGLWWAGTLDLRGVWERMPWIIDLKCTDTVYPSHPVQTAGYELTLPKPAQPPFCYRRGSVHLSGDGSYQLRAHPSSRDRATFLAALQKVWGRKRSTHDRE